jgi:hypothetical protein
VPGNNAPAQLVLAKIRYGKIYFEYIQIRYIRHLSFVCNVATKLLPPAALFPDLYRLKEMESQARFTGYRAHCTPYHLGANTSDTAVQRRSPFFFSFSLLRNTCWGHAKYHFIRLILVGMAQHFFWVEFCERL